MGAALSQLLPPQVLTVSPARRAQLTLAGLCAGWPGLDALEHGTEEALYTFDSEDLLDWLQAQGAGPPSLFLLGHNPALTDLVNTLVGAQALANLPTAGYVCLEIPVDRWARLGEQPARLVRQLFPKMLPRD
jgi:phosphohistidine phosphatase